ncbi:hypothetical protein [Tessaracoccus sp. OH4464_COT-324]|uniref:hypothetical protein n=1 Tax=Tessaracoccus sp. OH4464_COT-324 TaxID=2491059 RepID=UPI000F63BA79|nr:hypothetical protein [Tessaracoccus sp. OH4464_COT-324]RRD46341.1 hypothetical protein EII42_07475 [Tessaracoccus sp. OH4464_COT-324]
MSTANIDINYGAISGLSVDVSEVSGDLAKSATKVSSVSVSSSGFQMTDGCNSFSGTVAQQINDVSSEVSNTADKLSQTANSVSQMEQEAAESIEKFFSSLGGADS